MRIEIDAKILPAATRTENRGNDKPRLIFDGAYWGDWDLTFCIHGEKLRWDCDLCNDCFERHP